MKAAARDRDARASRGLRASRCRARRSRDRNDAGARRHAIDQHGAGAAFAESAAVFRSVQFEIVTQHVEQCGVGRGIDIMVLPLTVRRIVLRVCSLGPGCAANVARDAFAKIPFVYKRASWRSRHAACCPLYEQGAEANEFLFGNGDFCRSGRLTGFRAARRIVRIRTIYLAAKTGYDRSRPSQACS